MEFTYMAYRELLQLLQSNGYTFVRYHDWEYHPRCVILRHDVDNSLERALTLAEIEAEIGVCSTYFVLLRTDFYNPASKAAQDILQRIHSLGHEIGLHFDEVAYKSNDVPVEEQIRKESGILASICGFPIRAVSMHRPSQNTLEADLQIPGIVNSYGKTFFRDFKYLSDSRRNWREPVLDIVRSGEYERLHILTHAFWYREQEETLEETVFRYIQEAQQDRYRFLESNIRDLDSILPRSAIQKRIDGIQSEARGNSGVK